MLKIRGVTKIDYISNDRISRKREHANLYMYTVRSMKSRLQKKTRASRRQYTKSWEGNYCLFNTLRTGSFKLFKRPFPGFLTILTL